MGIAAVLLLVVAAEVVLRLAGNQAGVLYRNADVEMDDEQVQISPCYIADSFGVTKFSPYAKQVIADDISRSLLEDKPVISKKAREIYHDDLVYDYLPFSEQNEFARWAHFLKPSDDSLAFAIKDYVLHPLNADGFRSIDFYSFPTKKKKVLLLGDSFTYGFYAEPLSQSFYDLMLHTGKYAVYNTGITSVDPVQYLAVAKEYVPLLKPDYVIINFYWGNDLMYLPRQAKPGQFENYPTTGCLMIDASPFGTYLTLQEANAVARLYNGIPNTETNWLNRWLAKTVLGTRLWVLGNKLLGKAFDPAAEAAKKYGPLPQQGNVAAITNAVIDSIFSVCKSNGTDCLLSIIPDCTSGKSGNNVIPYSQIFDDRHFFLPPVNDSWYSFSAIRGYGHFNNYGHKMYAQFLLQQLGSLQPAHQPWF